MLASGNLGLIYLMEDAPPAVTWRRSTSGIPPLIDALRHHPHIGFLLVRSRERAVRWCSARAAVRYLADDIASRARTRSRRSRPARRTTCAGPTGSSTSPTSWSTASTTPSVEQGCAFEELISFHGGLGGPQTQPFILHPVTLPMPDAPVVGAEAVHELLMRWRFSLQRPRALAAPAVDGLVPQPSP